MYELKMATCVKYDLDADQLALSMGTSADYEKAVILMTHNGKI